MASNTTSGLHDSHFSNHTMPPGEITSPITTADGLLGNSTNASNHPTESFVPVSRPPIPVTIYVFYLIFIIIGLSTNIANMAVLRRFKRSTMTFYLLALAVCDFLFCASLASSMNLLVNRYFTSYWYNAVNLYFWVPIMHITPGASLWVTILIAIDRLLHVISPLKAHVMMTVTKAKVAVFLVTLVSVLGRLPYGWLYEVKVGETEPGEFVYWYSWSPLMFSSFGRVYLIVSSIVFEYIPTGILIICNPLIVMALFKHRRNRARLFGDGEENSTAVVSKEDSEGRMILLLFGVCLQSIICNLPVSITRLVWFSSPTSALLIKNISNLLFIFDKCGNFFVYCISNRDFRRSLIGKDNSQVSLRKGIPFVSKATLQTT